MGAIMSLFQIHAHTERIARRLAGSKAFPAYYENANPVPIRNSALVTFRAPNVCRSESAIKLRKAVADVVREERQS